jgi:hypothetical protein
MLQFKLLVWDVSYGYETRGVLVRAEHYSRHGRKDSSEEQQCVND